MTRKILLILPLILLIACTNQELIDNLSTYQQQIETDYLEFEKLNQELNNTESRTEFQEKIDHISERIDVYFKHLDKYEEFLEENEEDIEGVTQEYLDLDELYTLYEAVQNEFDTESEEIDNNAIVNLHSTYLPSIMSSVYNQYETLGIPLIEFQVTNNEEYEVDLRFVTQIQGYTEESINVETIQPGETKMITQTPLFTAQAPTEIKSANLYFKVTNEESDQVFDEQTVPIKIYARDTVIWGVEEDNEFIDTSFLIGAWVTPHTRSVEKVVRQSAEFTQSKSMEGYQCGDCTDEEHTEYIADQVSGIFSSLKNSNIAYINSPVSYSSKEEASQRVRLPSDSLELQSANCIDGVVVFASAMENIGLKSHIAFIPGHAFVCWDISQDSEIIDCVETTMISSSSFEEANEQGINQFNDHQQKGDLTLLSINQVRDLGIVPME